MRLVRSFAVAMLFSVVAGCGVDEIVYYPLDAGTGDNGDAGDAGTDDAGDAGDDDGGPSSLCVGQCVALPPPNFSDPLLLWTGSAANPPACPKEAPEPFKRFGDLSAPPATCDTCLCKPSTGSCHLPSSFAAHSEACNIPGAMDTSFDAPTDWDGSCTAANSIPAGAQCDGKPCVQSLTVGALETVDDGCKLDLPEPPTADVGPPGPVSFAPPTWGTLALACSGLPPGGPVGCGSGEMCIPSPEPPPEFRVCVMKDGDVPCEGERYVERFVYYRDYEDTRGCTPCGCGPVEGSLCTALVSTFTDAACTAPLFGGYPVSSLKSPCLDLTPAGEALGSKSMSNITYHPGVCQPTGGEPQGGSLPVNPATFCCVLGTR